MITINKIEKGNNALSLYALSSDLPLPTEEIVLKHGAKHKIVNGSDCYIIDTGDIYVYDEENKQWY